MAKTLYSYKSKIHGNGLCLKEGAKKGEKIATISGDVHVFREITPEISKKYINHSCSPNVAIKGKRTVYALNDIPPKTEITMDYSLTEAEPGWGIKNCRCKTEKCRESIGPISSLPTTVFKSTKKIIPKNFQRIYYVDSSTKN